MLQTLFKLLEFDGLTWNSYPINKETVILSLAVDKSGLVYADHKMSLVCLNPTKEGNWNTVRYLTPLKKPDSDFTNIWRVNAFSGGVAFQAEEKLFLYKNGKQKVIKPTTSFHTSFVVNDILYVRQRGIGLMEWRADHMNKIEGAKYSTRPVYSWWSL